SVEALLPLPAPPPLLPEPPPLEPPPGITVAVPLPGVGLPSPSWPSASSQATRSMASASRSRGRERAGLLSQAIAHRPVAHQPPGLLAVVVVEGLGPVPRGVQQLLLGGLDVARLVRSATHDHRLVAIPLPREAEAGDRLGQHVPV